jgi:hypothetical protein
MLTGLEIPHYFLHIVAGDAYGEGDAALGSGTVFDTAFRSVWAGALSGNSGRFAVILVAGWEAFRQGHH